MLARVILTIYVMNMLNNKKTFIECIGIIDDLDFHGNLYRIKIVKKNLYLSKCYTHRKKFSTVTRLLCIVVVNTQVYKVLTRSDMWKWVKLSFQDLTRKYILTK